MPIDLLKDRPEGPVNLLAERATSPYETILNISPEPDKEFNKIGQAIADSEKFKMLPSEAYDLQDEIKKSGYSSQMDRTFQGTAGRGLIHGIAGLMESVSETTAMTGRMLREGNHPLRGKLGMWLMDTLGKELVKTGVVASDFYSDIMEEHEIPEDLRGNIIDNHELLSDVNWWIYNLADASPSLAASVIPGIGTSKYIQWAGKSFKWSPEIVKRLSYLGGMIAGGLAGGTLEGAGAYKEAKKRGMSEQEARASHLKMTISSAVLNALSVGKILKGSRSGFARKSLNYLTSGTVEGFTELAEEPIQEFILGGDWENIKKATREGINVLPISFVLGTGASVATDKELGKKLAEPLKGEAGAIFPEGEKPKTFEESLKAKAKELGIKDHIGEKEDINAIQRDTFGDMVKSGKVDEAVTHAVEGVEKYDKQTINDAIVAEEVKQVAEAKKEDRDAVRANFKELKAKFSEAMEVEPGKVAPELEKELDTALDEVMSGQKEIEDIEIVTEEPVKKTDKGVKKRIRELTGQVKEDKFVKEYDALLGGMNKAVKAGREAYRSGKKEAIAKSKIELKTKIQAVQEKAQEKIAKIKTEKQIIQGRRQKIRSIRDTLMMTDAQLKKIGKKDIRLMSNFEFKQYADQIYEKAIQLQETSKAKAEVDDLINRMEFKGYDNLIKVYGLPSISKMSEGELNEFHDTLSQYEKSDVFLSPARLEAIERTDLRGSKTWREVKEHLAKAAGVPIKEIETIDISQFDMFKGDAALSEKDPFFNLIVSMMTGKMLQAKAKFIDIEKQANELAKKSNKSRGLTLKEKLIPQDKQIQTYIESESDNKIALSEDMTPEQIEYAHYMQRTFKNVYEQMLQDQVINNSRFTDDNYYAHIRRGFVETLADGGLKEAFGNMLRQEAEDKMKFGIIDDTGQILAYEKFFSHIMYRSGNMVATANVTKSFKAYMQAYFKKQALDEIIVLIDMYAQAVSPTTKTRKGLPYDPAIKEFINKWINTKKGRKISFNSVIPQGGKIDILLRGGKALTTMLHLGLNIPVQMAAPAGEQSATFVNIGAKRYALALKRYSSKQGQSIVEKYENFIGKSLWEEMALPDKEASERLYDVLFGLFSISYREANKMHLLSALTESEFKSGEISTEKLSDIKLEMARYRHVQGMESIVGATSLGKAGTQYKSWALPILGRTARNLIATAKGIKGGKSLSSKEAQEVYRGILTTVTLLTIYSSIDEKDDKSFLGQIKAKIMRETLTFAQGVSPDVWARTPVLMAFIDRLGKNIMMIIKMERYKRTGELKGLKALQKQFTPVAAKHVLKEEKTTKRKWKSSITQ